MDFLNIKVLDLFANLGIDELEPSKSLEHPIVVSSKVNVLESFQPLPTKAFIPSKGAHEEIDILCISPQATSSVTLFEQRVFGKHEVVLDIYHYFGNKMDRAWIHTTLKDEGLTHGEIVFTSMLEVHISMGTTSHTGCSFINVPHLHLVLIF